MILNKIAGILFIFLGVKILLLQDFSGNWGYYSFSEFYLYIPISLLLFYVGYKFLIYNKANYTEFSICPKCKETFYYYGLKNGKCKYCDDVDTVDIEEYYKNNPDKKRNKK